MCTWTSTETQIRSLISWYVSPAGWMSCFSKGEVLINGNRNTFGRNKLFLHMGNLCTSSIPNRGKWDHRQMHPVYIFVECISSVFWDILLELANQCKQLVRCAAFLACSSCIWVHEQILSLSVFWQCDSSSHDKDDSDNGGWVCLGGSILA